jgi:hypothetical protein
MGTNRFTKEQMEVLRQNPYVGKISETTITYTTEFREKFGEEYNSGKPPSLILSEMGLNPHWLGKRRKDSIIRRVKDFELRSDGFKDTRSANSGRPSTKELTDVEKITRLKQKIEFLKQENEFLKKNIQLDRMAEWEYKRSHPTNTTSSKK